MSKNELTKTTSHLSGLYLCKQHNMRVFAINIFKLNKQ